MAVAMNPRAIDFSNRKLTAFIDDGKSEITKHFAAVITKKIEETQGGKQGVYLSPPYQAVDGGGG